MKKNDFATFIVYVAMFAIALLVGFLVIKPIMETSGSLPLHPVLIMVFGLVGGVIFNAAILELGHALGARTGKYRILRCIVLGVGVKRVNGKLKFGFGGFDGLAGETKVAPKDVKESSLTAYIFFPILFLFVEFVGCMVGIVICQNKTDHSLASLHILLVTILTIGGMIFFYDLFPARLDSVTDGYLLVLLSKPANKEAYNNLLLAEEAALEGAPIPETPVYDAITDFTATLNFLTVYRHLTAGHPDEALPILDPIINAEKDVSISTKYQALALKLTILLERDDKSKGKALYEELDDAQKKYIASIADLTALRAYFLIASFIEGSENEGNYAIDKVERNIKSCDPNYKEAEKSLLQLDVDLAREAHPSWDIYRLPWEEKPTSEE